MNNKRTNLSQTKILTVFGILLLLNTSASWADIKLPAIIRSNMVLQQDMKVPIWGWAEPGEEVTVSVSWHSMKWAVTADKDGKWKFKMTPPQAGGPYEMTLSGKNTIKLENIMVGEVWVCSGQSNMEWPVAQTNNAKQEIAAADYPNIRLFTVVKRVADKPQSDCKGRWTQCSPQTIAGFSAVGYFFGRELHKELNVPIGLIHTSWGGTPSEAWTRREILEKEADAAPILERYDEAVAKYPQAKKDYEQKVEEWKKAAEQAKSENKPAPQRPWPPLGPGHSHAPSGLYNAMLAPLIPYGIKGAIWYQGETNAGRAYQYRKIFPAMIKNWRNDWGQKDFPFLFVQLANYKAVNPEPVESYWAELREAQLMTLDLPNTGMAVIIDIGEADDIHPRNKQDVGKRLALWALAKSYGKELVYSGPIFKSMTIKNEKTILNFDHVGGGLTAGGGESLKGFAIAGADRKFVWADAKIEDNQIVVSSDKVTNPVAVRYAWADNPICNLYNKEGLPATPFRTDDWPGVTINNK
ncbi:MAG: sialate O-acetylesterase [Phycisphaerales bacterium]|jgi:sialate O-acetylesterase